MAEKVTLEDLARAEAVSMKQREKARIAFAEAERKLAIEVPELFFSIAKGVREGVRRFNEITYKESGPTGKLIKYEESTAVTTRDPNIGTDFSFSLRRAPNDIHLVLRSMWRPNKPDAMLIEGAGNVGVKPVNHQRFLLRIDGLGKADGSIVYRSTCNFQVIDTPIDEIPERMVMVVVTGQVTRLWNKAPWLDL